MVTLTEAERNLLRAGNFENFDQIVKDPTLLKINGLTVKQFDIRLGEPMCLIKRAINPKTGVYEILPDKMLDAPERHFWYFWIAGYNPDTRKLVVGRYYRSGGANHYDLPGYHFIKTLSEVASLIRTGELV